MSKVRMGLLLGVSAIVVLTISALPAVVTGGVERQEALRVRMERLQSVQGRFRELAIGLRHGISGNYDEANALMKRIVEERAGLAAHVAHDISLHRLWLPYFAAVRDQEAQWEDFKRHNAQVRNSLHFFQSEAIEFTRRLGSAGLDHELMALGNGLFAQALGESGDAGTETASQITAAMARMSAMAHALPAGARDELAVLLRHAAIIRDHGPALAVEVNNLVRGSDHQALLRLAEANHAMLDDELALARHYRAGLLLGMALLLLALYLLATRYLDNLRRSAREHLLAETVFESSQQGIVVTDEHGHILRANRAYCRMTGYQESELQGRNPRLLKSGEQDAAFYQAMWTALRAEGRWQGEMKNRRQSGEMYVEWLNIDAVRGEQGELLYVGIASDISELVNTRERLANLAYFDTLTGLPNRVLFQDRLLQAITQCRREHSRLALILVDLDNFKMVNDTMGHAAGDEMLQQVAARLRARVRDSDTVARLGGDEFALILANAHDPRDIARLAGEVVESLAQPYRLVDLEVAGSASLGVTFYPDDGTTEAELLRHADVAMYRAKELGRNDYQFFTLDMADGAREAMRIESSLRRAIDSGELSMHYQPQVASDGRLIGAEALMRWDSAELGRVPPMQFIPVAEKSGLIASLGAFALREACRQCATWRRRLSPEFRVAVNLSAAQFRNEYLAEQVAGALLEFGLPGNALELEITESVVMEDVERGQAMLKSLKRQGCRLAIDDFGTGYSSLSYLKRFPVDLLKIDKSFVAGLGFEADDTAVARAIIGLARSLRLEVVAEGVETREQFDCLAGLAEEEGFIAQGYYFSAPLPAAKFEQRIQEGGFQP